MGAEGGGCSVAAAFQADAKHNTTIEKDLEDPDGKGSAVASVAAAAPGQE